MPFDLTNVEAWTPAPPGGSGSLLPVGVHLVRLSRIKRGTSSGGFPQLECEFTNDEGFISQNLVITESAQGKLAALIDACGVRRPVVEDWEDNIRGILTESYVRELDGKPLQISVDERPSYRDPNRKYREVTGYASVSAGGVPEQPVWANAPGQPSATKTEAPLPF